MKHEIQTVYNKAELDTLVNKLEKDETVEFYEIELKNPKPRGYFGILAGDMLAFARVDIHYK